MTRVFHHSTLLRLSVMYVRFLCSASKVPYTFAKITPWTNLRKNISRECSRKCFRDVVNLLLWKLLINACMRDLWVRYELIQGMCLVVLDHFYVAMILW